MPQFSPSESKVAVAPITVRPAGLSSEAEIFLGPDEMTKVATSGRIPFTSTGVSQNIRLSIAMPAAEGSYHVYIDVYAEGLLIAAYQATEDMVIVSLPAGSFTVRMINYDTLLEASEALKKYYNTIGFDPMWYAQIPSSNVIPHPVTGQPIPLGYKLPLDGGYRHPSVDCPFLVDPQEYEYRLPYPNQDQVQLQILLGPIIGVSPAYTPTGSYGLYRTLAPIEITPSCLIIFDFATKGIEVQR